MKTCSYIYCRAPRDDAGDRCPVCGHPDDEKRASAPDFVAEAIEALAPLPKAMVDMHQILPEHPRALMGQKLFMGALDIKWALLQSSPPEATSLVGNEGLSELQKDDPEAFKVSWYLDPRSPAMVDDLAAAQAHDAGVVKLLPVAGYRLDDPALLGFWEEVRDRKLALMVHTGFISARHKAEEAKAEAYLNSSYGDPLQVDEPARRFPEVPIIIAHCGGALFHEAGAQLVTQHDNIFGDISGFGLFALRRWLQAKVTVDWSKVFWGNDSVCTAYPTNLRLLQDALRSSGAQALTDGLLRDNGLHFAERYFS